MLHPDTPRRLLPLSLALALVTASAAALGIFYPPAYAKETVSWAAQGRGQDVIDLFVIAPMLALAAQRVRRGALAWLALHAGLFLYLAYSFALYSMAMHFNALFLLYCAGLGLSVWGLILLFRGVDESAFRDAFDERTPVRVLAAYLGLVALLFALAWLGEVVPAILGGSTPKSLAEVGLIVNPVQVLDLSLVLPTMAIAARLLWKRHPAGILLGLTLTAFAACMNLALIAMFVSQRSAGLPLPVAMEIVFGMMTLVSVGLYVACLRHGKLPTGRVG